jgi:hypothetical protein
MIRKVLDRTAWLSAGSLIGRACPVLVMILLGTEVSTAVYASISIAFLWGTVVYSITLAGLSTIVVQQLARIDESGAQRRAVQRSGGWALLVAVIPAAALIMLGGDRAADMFDHAFIADMVVPAACAGTCWSLFSFLTAALNGLHKSRHAAVAAGIAGALQATGLVTGARVLSGAAAPIWGLAAGSLLAALGVALMIHRAVSGSANEVPVPLELNIRAKPLLLATISAASVTPINFAVSHIAAVNGGTHELAAFLALEQLHQLAVYVPNILTIALLPLLAQASMRDPQLARRLVRWSIGLAIAATLIGAVAGLAAGDVQRLIGNPALDDLAAMRIMMLNAGLALSLSILGAGLVAFSMFGRALFANLVWAGLFLGLSWHYASHGVVALQAARLTASWVLIGLASILLWQGARRSKDTMASNAIVGADASRA